MHPNFESLIPVHTSVNGNQKHQHQQRKSAVASVVGDTPPAVAISYGLKAQRPAAGDRQPPRLLAMPPRTPRFPRRIKSAVAEVGAIAPPNIPMIHPCFTNRGILLYLQSPAMRLKH
jgi:hypothetical protein